MIQTYVSENQIVKLNDNGFEVYQETNPVIIDQYNTDIFIVDKQGLERPYYNELWQIPVLPPGTEGSLNIETETIPYEVQKEDCGAYLHLDPQLVSTFSKNGKEIEYSMMKKQGLPITWITVAFILLLAIIISVICIFIYATIDRINIVHGRETQVENIDEYTKVVTKPNCQARTWDSLNHQWTEGDTWSEPGVTPGEELSRWMLYAVIGLVGVAGIYLLATFFKTRERREYYKAYPGELGYEPPPPPKELSAEKVVKGIGRGAKKVKKTVKKGIKAVRE